MVDKKKKRDFEKARHSLLNGKYNTTSSCLLAGPKTQICRS